MVRQYDYLVAKAPGQTPVGTAQAAAAIVCICTKHGVAKDNVSRETLLRERYPGLHLRNLGFCEFLLLFIFQARSFFIPKNMDSFSFYFL